jgi:sugar lactone lactonase YvrE
MKQKTIIIVAVILVLTIIGLMVYDFYYESQNPKNPYEYSLEDLKKIDESEICYTKTGEINPEIQGAYALAIDDKDRIFVAGENQLSIINKVGDVIKKAPIMNPATCIALHPDGNIFIGTKDHIEVYDRNARLINQWPAINAKAHITGIATEANDLFVADAGNKIVYHYDLEGNLINTIGEKNPQSGFGGFIVPSPHFDLALGREGQLWVVNTGKHEFLAFNKNGEIFSSWKKTSMQLDGFSGCCNPGNIALLSDGSFVTSEKGIERVKIHHPNGDYKCVVANPSELSAGCQHFDLAVDSQDRIFVLDTRSGVIKIFEKRQNLTGLPPKTAIKALSSTIIAGNFRPVRLTTLDFIASLSITCKKQNLLGLPPEITINSNQTDKPNRSFRPVRLTNTTINQNPQTNG